MKLISATEEFDDSIRAEAMTDVFTWFQVCMSGEDIKTKMANNARNGDTHRPRTGRLPQCLQDSERPYSTIGWWCSTWRAEPNARSRYGPDGGRLRPLPVVDIGQVLHPDDVAADKVLTLWGRARTRDFLRRPTPDAA
jgi:hypothetical protein